MNVVAIGGRFACAALLCACAWRTEDGDPVEVPISLEFPSSTAAVTVDSVSIYAFEGGQCQALMQEYRSNRSSRGDGIGTFSQSAVLESDICSIFEGKAKATLPLGTYALVAIATGPEGYANGQPTAVHDYFTGCVEQTVGGAAAVLPITMALATDVKPAFKSSCTSLKQYCERSCPGT